MFKIDPSFGPHTFTFSSSGGPGSADRKAPPAATLYPELSDYTRLDAGRYWKPEHMRLERDRLWTCSWTCAGRVSDLPDVGHFFRYNLGRESFIIVRGRDGSIRGDSVCQHRGRRPVERDFGMRMQFVCPFHLGLRLGWLEPARHVSRGVLGKGVVRQLDLKEVRCEIWA